MLLQSSVSHQPTYLPVAEILLRCEYASVDEMQPTAKSGGKGKVLKLVKEKFHFKSIVMISHGAIVMEP